MSLKEEDTRKIKKVVDLNGHQSGEVFSPEGLSRTLCCTDWKAPMKIIESGEEKDFLKINETTKKGYKEAYPDDGVLLNRIGRKIQKGIVRHGHSGSLTTDGSWGCVTNEYRIRRLTPVECERLQGFPDNWTEKGVDDEEISNTQRYKCLGNAVTTTVITYLMDNWELKE